MGDRARHVPLLIVQGEEDTVLQTARLAVGPADPSGRRPLHPHTPGVLNSNTATPADAAAKLLGGAPGDQPEADEEEDTARYLGGEGGHHGPPLGGIGDLP